MPVDGFAECHFGRQARVPLGLPARPRRLGGSVDGPATGRRGTASRAPRLRAIREPGSRTRDSAPRLAPTASNGIARLDNRSRRPSTTRSIGTTADLGSGHDRARGSTRRPVRRHRDQTPRAASAQRPARQADPDLGDQRRGRDLVHRARRTAPARLTAPAHSQISRCPGRPGRGHERRTARADPARTGGDVADVQLVRRRLAERAVDVAEVAAEQLVELAVVVRRMVVAVPPEPVAAFGDRGSPRAPRRASPARRRRDARRTRARGRASCSQARWSSRWPIQM